ELPAVQQANPPARADPKERHHPPPDRPRDHRRDGDEGDQEQGQRSERPAGRPQGEGAGDHSDGVAVENCRRACRCCEREATLCERARKIREKDLASSRSKVPAALIRRLEEHLVRTPSECARVLGVSYSAYSNYRKDEG